LQTAPFEAAGEQKGVRPFFACQLGSGLHVWSST
jgi:hypothetical protein